MIRSITDDSVDVGVRYGLFGTGCRAGLQRELIEGMSARGLILRVADQEQASSAASRAACVVREILQRGERSPDVAVTMGPPETAKPGTPIELESVVIPKTTDRAAPVVREVTLDVTEPYIGGRKRSIKG